MSTTDTIQGIMPSDSDMYAEQQQVKEKLQKAKAAANDWGQIKALQHELEKLKDEYEILDIDYIDKQEDVRRLKEELIAKEKELRRLKADVKWLTKENQKLNEQLSLSEM